MVWCGYLVLIVLGINSDYIVVGASCFFLATAETLTDCQWSQWCWSCDQCDSGGGNPILVRGKCCSGNDSTDARCQAKCGGQLNDFNITVLGQCSTTCQNRHDPSVCKTDQVPVTTTLLPTMVSTLMTPPTPPVIVLTSKTTTLTMPPTSTKTPKATTSQSTSTKDLTGASSTKVFASYGFSRSSKSSVFHTTTVSQSGPGESGTDTSLGPIIGGVVGGVCVIAALIGLSVYFLKRKTSHPNQKIEPEISNKPLP